MRNLLMVEGYFRQIKPLVATCGSMRTKSDKTVLRNPKVIIDGEFLGPPTGFVEKILAMREHAPTCGISIAD
jgi:hypothetical protein